EAERRREREPAEADVGNVPAAVDVDGQQHVRARRQRARISFPQHSRREADDAKTERLEDRGEQAVVLEAVPSSTRAHELRLERRHVETRALVEKRRQILEGDRRGMQAMERPERLEARLERSGESQPFRISDEIDAIAHARAELTRRAPPTGV